MNIQFGNLEQLNWLWLVSTVLVVTVITGYTHRRSLKRFATANLLPEVFPTASSFHGRVRSTLTILALLFLTLALVDIRWGKTWRDVPQKGIDVVFALDVSRSMLADDVAPNRLERAKQQIKDIVDEMAGDRVGLVVFAGTAKQQIPLTKHYHDFKNMLDGAGPFDIEQGGSRLGNAIELAADSFLDKTNDHKAIVIFTDGEDQESDPVTAAKQAYDQLGIRIFTVGLGDRLQGARVPALTRGTRSPNNEPFMKYEGQQVWSKLNNSILENVALATKGAYIPAETKSVDMASVYHSYIGNVEQKNFETARLHSFNPRFQIFLSVALILVLFEIFYPKRVTKNRLPQRLNFRAELSIIQPENFNNKPFPSNETPGVTA
ncbi:VWA domain-containing protein [Mariniblastus sp.]|nr:VWA domain-containing protein [Mariniblastus sp.]MDB4473073.1 VWA domain-containing protein [bacterium]